VSRSEPRTSVQFSADNAKTPPGKSAKRDQKASSRKKDSSKKPRSRVRKTRSEDQPELFD
jgi:hypothetical protein